MDWERCLSIMREFSDHYSLNEDAQKVIFDLAVTLPEGSNMLEIGVANGKTAAMLSYIATHNRLNYYGVDTFGLTNSEEVVRGLLNKFQLKHTIFAEESQTVKFDKPINLLFIDGGHDDVNITNDCNRFVPLVVSGGYAIFDDYDEPYNEDSPHKFVRLRADEATKGWEDVGYFANRIKIWRKP